MLTVADYYSPGSNALFHRLCPQLAWQPDTEAVGMEMNVSDGNRRESCEFMVVRKTVGELFQVLAAIMTGDPVTDRGNTRFDFGKPIEIESLLEQYRRVVSGDRDIM